MDSRGRAQPRKSGGPVAVSRATLLNPYVFTLREGAF